MKPSHRASSLRAPLTTVSALLMMVLCAGPSQAQRQDGGNPSTLQSARKIFATADVDMDGFLSRKEASTAGVPAREFSARDKDKSGTWSREEFLFYYQTLLLNSGKRPDKEFQNEVARIEAMRRAQEAEELRRAQEKLRKIKKEGGASSSSGDAKTGGGDDEETLSQKLKRAREALKDRSKRAGADRDAFDHTAGELAERARGAAGGSDDEAGDTSDEDWAIKLRRSRAALELRAKDGRWSREQLEAADRRLTERARAAQQGVDLTALPAPVRSKYERSLVALTDRAQAGNWSREKYEGELADLLSRAKEEINGRGSEASTGEITRSRRDYERALAALDERAKAGGWTRERYESERTELAERLQIRDLNDGEDSSNSSQEQEVGDGPATQADFDQAQKTLGDVVKGAGSDIRTKHERALNALIARAQRAGMTRTAFGKERDRLIARARLEAGDNRATEVDFAAARATLATFVTGVGSDIRTKHQRALNALIARAQKAGMTRAAFGKERDRLIARARLESDAAPSAELDFDHARKALGNVMKGSGSDIRTKHERALNALIARAQKAGMTRAAFGNELKQLLARAHQEARAGQADFDEARKTLATALGGSGSNIRTKHERALNALIARAQKAEMTRAAFESERDQLIARARREAGAGQVTEADFDEARKTLVRVTSGEPDVRKKYERALNALIIRAQKAGMTRTAFENERDQLIARAKREALGVV